ncbi:uncharacterized protein TNCV_4821 [Trichonephila clavipes]|nr:uncharacterized protein TNCV_4821 [Trichonephila clavipes]
MVLLPPSGGYRLDGGDENAWNQMEEPGFHMLGVLHLTQKDSSLLEIDRNATLYRRHFYKRYETQLLWKDSPEGLMNNLFLAKKGFENLQNNFKKMNWVAEEYKDTIQDQFSKGIIEECSRDEYEYFMPHRPVVRNDKDTTKVRIVVNCSSKIKENLSLNDFHETGPNLNPNVLDILLNFWKFKTAFSADIEKAFLMISIAEEDRKFFKFLWFPDNCNENFKFM